MSIGLYTHTTRATGTTLTAAIYNSDHQNHITNQNPSQTGAYSDNVSQMQAVTDPGGLGTEVLATHLGGELERLRFAIKRITGKAQWYIAPDNDLSAIGSPTDFLFTETFRGTGDLTPAQITSNQNNYAPTGHDNAFTFRLSSDAVRNISGLAGGVNGRIVILDNVGANAIQLTHEDAGSTAANRFTFNSGQAPVVLSAGEAMMLKYDGTSSRWRALNTADQANPSFVNGTFSGNVTLTAGFQEFTEIASPANPAANVARLYGLDVAGLTVLAYKDSAGLETILNFGLSAPARGYAEVTAFTTTSSQIPLDDSIPQVGEGLEILSISLAMKKATSKARITFNAPVTTDSNNEAGVFAAFLDGGANAIGVASIHIGTGNQVVNASMDFEITPGDTSSHTYSIRMGPSGGSSILAINGTSAARRFGGAARATLVVEEIFV